MSDSQYRILVSLKRKRGFFFQNVEYHDRLVEQGRLLYELVYGSHDEEDVSTVINNYTYNKMVNLTKKILLLIKAM